MRHVCSSKRALVALMPVTLALLAGCGTYPYPAGPVNRIAPTRVDPAFTGASTRVDPRFVARGPYVGTGIVNRGPLFGAATGLRRY